MLLSALYDHQHHRKEKCGLMNLSHKVLVHSILNILTIPLTARGVAYKGNSAILKPEPDCLVTC